MIVNLVLGLSSLFLLGCSAFFSGSETALFALPAQERHPLSQREDARARGVLKLLAELRTVLVTVLVGNTFVNVLLAVLATRLFIRTLGPERGVVVSGVAVTGILLLFGEILPKTLAVRAPLRFSLFVSRPLLRAQAILAGPTILMRGLSRAVVSVLDRLVPGDDLEMQGDEMLALMSLGEESGGIDAMERRLVEGVFELGDRSVQEVMTQRVDLFLLESDELVRDAAVAMRRAGRSYAPVFRATPDHIVGLVSAFDLLAAPAETPVSEIAREAEYYPESIEVGALLRDLLEKHAPLAVILDEYGALAGMATLEDLYEVLVGEILDSEESESLRYYHPEPDVLVASSRLSLERAGELLGVVLASDEMETLGGFLMEGLAEVPEPGRSYELAGITWTVLSSRGPALGTLRLERRP